MLNLLLAPATLLFSQGASKALNLALTKDSAALKKLQALQGCVFEIHLRNLNKSIYVTVIDQKLAVLAEHASPTVRISGSISSLLQLRNEHARHGLFKSGEVQLSGDAVRAQQIMQWVAALDIDWEALLAEWLGDVPAHALGSGLRKSWQWTQQISHQLWRDLEEYVKYELRLLPTRPMAERQFQAIDQLRLASDRIEARYRKLLQRTKAND